MESWSTLPFWGFIVCLVMMEKSALQFAARGWVSEGRRDYEWSEVFFIFISLQLGLGVTLELVLRIRVEECDNRRTIPGLFWRPSLLSLDYVEHTGKERLSS